MKNLNKLRDIYELDLYLAFNLAAKEANLNIEERHVINSCKYLKEVYKDSRRNPEYYYLSCLKQVLKDEEELTTMFIGKFLK